MKKLVLVILSLCLLVGCQSKTSDNLPKNAKNVADMGNHWFYFELEVGKKTRKFLLVSRYDDGSGARCVVELKESTTPVKGACE